MREQEVIRFLLGSFRNTLNKFSKASACQMYMYAGILQPKDMSRACLLTTFNCWIMCLLTLQRNGPSAYQHVISALEGRRLQQEDEGLQPTSKPLYKVTGVKMLLASVRNELRLAKSKVPGKTSIMSWLQVGLSLVFLDLHIYRCSCPPVKLKCTDRALPYLLAEFS